MSTTRLEAGQVWNTPLHRVTISKSSRKEFVYTTETPSTEVDRVKGLFTEWIKRNGATLEDKP